MIITGKIEANRILVRVEVEGATGLTEVEAILDTGFNGDLMLSTETISALSLQAFGKETFVVASGDLVESTLFSAHLQWSGRRQLVEVLETRGKHNLLGMNLLSRCIITINLVEKTVMIEKSTNHN